LRAAERLIATNGIDTVSLRQIAAESGSRNPSVVHYHFGSRLGLLRAVVEYRSPSIDRRIRELLDELVQEHREHDLRGLVEAMARPLLELDQHSHYLAFLARLYARPEREDAFLSMAGSTSSIPLLRELLDVALPFLPADVRDQRLRMAADLVVTTIANRRSREAAGSGSPLPDAQFAQQLFDAMVGLLGAPHTVLDHPPPLASTAE
jgi:AcrR family transcriptional regulator